MEICRHGNVAVVDSDGVTIRRMGRRTIGVLVRVGGHREIDLHQTGGVRIPLNIGLL